MIDAIQPAEVKAAVIAALQGFRFGDTPFHQGIAFTLASPGFVSCNSNKVFRVLLAFQTIDFLGEQVGFELPCTPAYPDAGPAVPIGRDTQPLSPL